MRKLVYYVAVTVDGRIAGPGGEFDFFPQGEGEQLAAYHGWMAERLPETIPTVGREAVGVAGTANRRFDTVLMGGATYRVGPANPFAHLRQYVVSRTMTPDQDPAVTVVGDDPLGLVRGLKREEGQDLWLCGGGQLASALLPEIDELIVKSYPVVAGDGIPAFDGEFGPTLFAVTERRSFDNGVVVSWLARR
ncbi:dihydrofolate reductase family protein [Streptomyces profundus]|uniref:dihydrofolate reductase family protein n=1 Tax=Streptomyces profundus TaxID=2867410 RepID=UPI001D1621C7|nr:dihydrofolate reductase family protein [Streptomyces sp. MA3_2.13]UED86125.1 dihydrofolate reductase family protein [Streptomyces sp. MA3_2.13]